MTGSDEEGAERAKDFQNWFYEAYPALDRSVNGNNLPFAHDFVQFMNSEDDLVDYDEEEVSVTVLLSQGYEDGMGSVDLDPPLTLSRWELEFT